MKKALFLITLLSLTGACRRHSVTIDSNGNTVAVDGKTGQVTIKTDNGTAVYTAGAGATLPSGFPSDVPLYPGAAVTGSVNASGQPGKESQVVTFETKDSAESVAAFYKSKLSGWQMSAEVGTPDGKMLVLQSPDSKRTVTLLAGAKSGKTTASLTITGS
jgi:hypothetical protein